MLSFIKSKIEPLNLTASILDEAYQLYLKAPEGDYPTINLRQLSRITGKSLLDCRNAIVSANRAGRFPNCQLET